MFAFTGETMILNVAWNPGFPSLFATCLSSGSVLMMELTEREVKILMSLPADHKASASEENTLVNKFARAE